MSADCVAYGKGSSITKSILFSRDSFVLFHLSNIATSPLWVK